MSSEITKGIHRERTKAMWKSFCPFLPDPSEFETCTAISDTYVRRGIILFLLGFCSTVAGSRTSRGSICFTFWNSPVALWSAYELSPNGKPQPFKYVVWVLSIPLCLSCSSNQFFFQVQSLNWNKSVSQLIPMDLLCAKSSDQNWR